MQVNPSTIQWLCLVLNCIFKIVPPILFTFLQYLKAILDEGVFWRDFGTMQENVKLEDATGKMAVKSKSFVWGRI